MHEVRPDARAAPHRAPQPHRTGHIAAGQPRINHKNIITQRAQPLVPPAGHVQRAPAALATANL
jgi:hypothetical protein